MYLFRNTSGRFSLLVGIQTCTPCAVLSLFTLSIHSSCFNVSIYFMHILAFLKKNAEWKHMRSIESGNVFNTTKVILQKLLLKHINQINSLMHIMQIIHTSMEYHLTNQQFGLVAQNLVKCFSQTHNCPKGQASASVFIKTKPKFLLLEKRPAPDFISYIF